MLRSHNPAFRQPVFAAPAQGSTIYQDIESVQAPPGVMTVSGAVNKTSILLLLCAAAAVGGWSLTLPVDSSGALVQPRVSPQGLLFGGAILGMLFALATFFKPAWARITAPLYALSEGLFLGALSAMVAFTLARQDESGALIPYTGLVMNAALLTMGVLGAMLIAYKTRLVRATEKFKMGVFAATGAVFLVYLVDMIAGFFGASLPFLHSAGPVGIGVSLVIIAIAALNLVLDFDFIETAARNRAPKEYEWVAGVGLLVTLVWLYVEILRLLAILASRRD